MEVDLWPKSSEPGPSSSLLPTIDESSAMGHQNPKERLVKVLDQVEVRVERLRKDAARIEEDKDTLLATLDAIKHSDWMLELDEVDREDVQHSLGRILERCSTVEARVFTRRDQQQEEALNQVNQYIDALVLCVREDPVFAHGRCQSFMAACSSQTQTSEVAGGPSADTHFESIILGCTVDDQKKVKKRLQGLLDYFARLNVRCT